MPSIRLMVQQPLPGRKPIVKFKNMKKKFLIPTNLFLISALAITLLTGCSRIVLPYNGQDYIEISSTTDAYDNLVEAAENCEVTQNYDTKLSVPTYITQIDATWFIVDCYHNRVIYADSLDTPIDQWSIMCTDATQPHTIASDGTVYLIDDTENNRVLIYEKTDNKFIHTQTFYDIGNRPHYTVYDSDTDTFYVWSSTTGELYCFRRQSDSSRVYLTDVRKIEQLDGIYVRSFTIINGDIYFVSGVSDTDAVSASNILRCDLKTLDVRETYSVPNELAGMVQINKIQNYYYITVSTDSTGSQDTATIVRTHSLSDLIKGSYEDIYSTYFVGGGTPYYMSNVGDLYFLTEHRLTDHSIWSFKITNDNIKEVTALY